MPQWIGQRPMVSLVVWAAAGFVIGLLTSVEIGVAREHGTPAAAAAGDNVRRFPSDAGMVLNCVKPDKTTDFEAVMAKLHDALRRSEKPERRQQAESWKVFRAAEPGANGAVLYVFMIDPSVRTADYTVSTILSEGFPADVQTIFKQYADSYATGQNFVNLSLVSAFGR
jgi:hypothetical protein